MRRSPSCLALLLTLALALAAPARGQSWDFGQRNTDLEPAFANQTRAPRLESGVALRVETLAEGLDHPWGIALLPEGGYLVSERGGTLRHIGADGAASAPILGVPQVLARGQGGLLDVALATDFASSRFVYLTYAKPMGEGLSATAAARGRLSADLRQLTDLRDIFVQTPPSPTAAHYGSRIFPAGPHVWITTGEHASPRERVLAQDLATSYGKVIRLMADGSVPPDNPFVGQPGAAPEVWSFGHRNIQGAARRPGHSQLWTLEHGPQGGDELNLIERGANYGWPLVSYGQDYSGAPIGSGSARAPGLTEPRYFWDPVIAPGGFVFYRGALFPDWQGDIIAASLTPGGIVRLRLSGDTVVGEERFLYGQMRIRDIEIAADGAILALEDAAEGRLLRLTPAPQGQTRP
ncbi:MAG: PQQ-dependent sugar dehydrogenase [Phaeovulum sp.]|uniref:PQQ-dependent sugar dehydrogenase n=1 Tax=Phaeovulum sp. TaxID=2934796 RepID=UPI00272FFCF4|nr:PQQ-dependent sugar dehydrogenase [Phaeovulum sp.]MDP2062936.1 PQQ-dependent sugar dehydrogenase [Phaeovulum sp.]